MEHINLVAAGDVSHVYEGHPLEDPDYHYIWDFKNRLREVWTNESTPQLVAEYWYDSENRRTKKAVDSVPTVYFLDSWNEVQESDCFGVPLRQYVYGASVDELIVMDRPIVDVATVQETCALLSGGGTSDLEPALEECQDPEVSENPLGATYTCGPCTTLVSTGVEGAGVGEVGDCTVCVSSAWNMMEADEPSPVGGCFTCPVDASVVQASALVVSYEAGCTPCTPNVQGLLFFRSTTLWSVEAEASSGCTPCPAPDQELMTGANSTSPVPVLPEPNAELEEHCFGVNLDERLYFLQDEQRSVYGLANKDGELKQGFEYDPYGNVTVFTPVGSLGGVVSFTTSDDMGWAEDSMSPYLYTGRRYDPESGLLQYRTRYYDVEMGRFISRDTIGVWGDPNSLGNAYAYAGSRPHGLLDPSGRAGISWNFDIPTAEGAGALRFEFFIAASSVFGIDGDGPDGPTGPEREYDRTRFAFEFNFDAGNAEVFVNDSSKDDGKEREAACGWQRGNHAVAIVGPETIEFESSLINAYQCGFNEKGWQSGPSVEFKLTITMGDGTINFDGVREKYPSLEISRPDIDHVVGTFGEGNPLRALFNNPNHHFGGAYTYAPS